MNVEREQAVLVVRRHARGRTSTCEGTVKSAGPRWVVIEYSLESGHKMTDTFDARTRCLKNFGDVRTFITPAELPALAEADRLDKKEI